MLTRVAEVLQGLFGKSLDRDTLHPKPMQEGISGCLVTIFPLVPGMEKAITNCALESIPVARTTSRKGGVVAQQG